MKFSAVILAGGNSSRMGRDKAFLETGGQTLLARQIQLVRTAGAAEVFISDRPVTDYPAQGCQVLLDQFAGAGPLAGIERALVAATSPLLLVLAVDLPEMNATLIRALAANCSDQLGAVPCLGEDIEPLAAFYPKAAHGLVERLLREESNAATTFARHCAHSGLVKFIQASRDQARYFRNWNCPAEVVP